MLVLALTDLHSGVAASGVKRAKEYLARITDEYQRTYYSGMIAERRGQALLAQGGMGSGGMAVDSLKEAMAWYERAEAIRPAGNDDAILRWNTCARVFERHSRISIGANRGVRAGSRGVALGWLNLAAIRGKGLCETGETGETSGSLWGEPNDTDMQDDRKKRAATFFLCNLKRSAAVFKHAMCSVIFPVSVLILSQACGSVVLTVSPVSQNTFP